MMDGNQNYKNFLNNFNEAIDLWENETQKGKAKVKIRRF